MQHYKTQRPVYLNLLKIKLPVTGILSILHRISGVFMVLSLPIMVYLFDLSLNSENDFQRVRDLFSHPLLKLSLGVFLWFLLHHMLAGIRYLLLDLDIGVDRPTARKSAFLINYLGMILLAVILFGVFSL